MTDAREKIGTEIWNVYMARSTPFKGCANAHTAGIAADAILAAMPDIVRGMVKPLVWDRSENFKASRSGAYVVQHEHDADGNGVWVMGADVLISEHPTEEAAKAAANDHNAAQVLKGLGL